MASTQTMTISREESQPQHQPAHETFELSKLKAPGRTLRELSRKIVGPSPRQDSSEDEDDIRADVPPPATAQPVTQRWNRPKANIGRLGFASFAFIIAGLNDGAVGVRNRSFLFCNNLLTSSTGFDSLCRLYPSLHRGWFSQIHSSRLTTT